MIRVNPEFKNWKSSSARGKPRPKKVTGLRYWMLRVLDECERVSSDFAAGPVHDLRVALRRCRSMADGWMAIDPDADWKAMKKAGRRLFQRLGALRDVQVMMEWVEKLDTIRGAKAKSSGTLGAKEVPELADPAVSPPVATDDSAAEALLEILRVREKEQKLEAHAALEDFDRKQWRQWSKSLPARAARLRPGNPLFKHLALERWTEARELHNRALRNRSQVAFHSLRIGIKRFRYIVENFLPAEHASWSDDLKKIQDLLGDVHDFDVLWATAAACQIFPDQASRQRWRELILSERAKRVEAYREKMVGSHSLWQTWRSGLPQGKQVEILATRRMKLWASRLDPDFPHSERVASLALQIYDGLLAWGWKPAVDAASGRSSLLAASLLHDVGKSTGGRGHQKTSFHLIRAHGNPLGWKPADMQRAAIVARFHQGSLPTRKKKSLRDLLPDEQKAVLQLTAILRLANAMDASHDGRIGRVQVENAPSKSALAKGPVGGHRTDGLVRKAATLAPNEPLVISAEGYSPLAESAQIISAERHLLETVLRRPVLIKAMKVKAVGRRQIS